MRRALLVLRVVAVAGLLVRAEPVLAQAAQVTTDVGPHYVGEAVSIRITAVGFEEEPPPVAEGTAPAGGRLELVGVSPSVSQSITIVNGRMSRTREVTHVFQFRFVADRPGEAVLGPFRIRQGAKAVATSAVRLKILAVPTNDDVDVALTIPSGEVFVGERVPVTISFTLDQSLQKNVLGYTLSVPLFDEQSAFRFLDEDTASGDTNVVIQTPTRQFELRGSSRTTTRNQKRYTTVSVTRTMVPLTAGTHSIPAVSLRVEEGVRFRRDFFGGRRATQVRRWSATDPGRLLEVLPVPGQQPASFGGGIGRGFTLEVSADRTVVQVGDPITLRFIVRGEGLETASLPSLDGPGLLPADRFRVPPGVPTGELVGDEKRFTVVVRVLDEDVTEIPALAYSWFDPDTKQYETTRSRPIALAVRSAEVIGASDVRVAARSEGLEGAEESARPRASAETDRADARAAVPGLALTGADLAIEPNPAVALGSGRAWGTVWLVPSLYAGSLALLAVAVWDRRRRQVDPGQLRRRQVLDEQLAKIVAAGSLPPAEGATQLARAIRALLREMPEASSAQLDRILGECDARSFAPAGAVVSQDETLVREAVELVEAFREELR